MAKATDAQISETQDAFANDPSNLPKGVRINFGDAEPIQAIETTNGDRPSLNGKTRAQLEDIAADENVDISDATTNAEITAAIEAARNQA